jgi:hypothetical protein
MNARMWGLVFGSVLILAAACGRAQENATAGAAAPAVVDRAIAVAHGIQANPAAADSILASHGLTRAGLDSLMYDVAEDSALARVYTQATR